MRRMAIAAVSLVLLAGCSDARTQDATDAAVRFVTGEPSQACALLAPQTLEEFEQTNGKPCAQALSEAGLPDDPGVVDVAVAGESARVRFAGQAVFLARFPSGWLVTAAGCERDDPDPAVPYDCEVES